MFSGLVEGLAPVLDVKAIGRGLRLCLKKPASFRSLKEGESLCVDGLCLTLESFDKKSLRFFLGPETLKITKWKAQDLKGWIFNLERSLSLQSRIGGHLVTGHIDGLARLKQITKQGDSRIAQIQIPPNYKKFFWKKGYIALNGVSLTINQAQGTLLELCLVPKTLKLTNLSQSKKGDFLNFEADYMSRPLIHNWEAFCKKQGSC